MNWYESLHGKNEARIICPLAIWTPYSIERRLGIGAILIID